MIKAIIQRYSELYSGIKTFIIHGIPRFSWAENKIYLKAKLIFGFSAAIIITLAIIWHMLFKTVPWIHEQSALLIPAYKKSGVLPDSAEIERFVKQYDKKIIAAEKKLNGYSNESYLVVNTTKNEFKLYQYGKFVREGICSTGSYIKLEYTGEKQWLFHTPKGMRRIIGKNQNPVWKKPDWAFIEEGKPVPPIDHPSRYEYGVLGAYSLSLGDGYLIHGTLYQRLLGMPVTHGCIRLGDDDLEAVYRTLKSGDRVYIY